MKIERNKNKILSLKNFKSAYVRRDCKQNMRVSFNIMLILKKYI